MLELMMVAIGGFFGAMFRFYISQKLNTGQKKLPIGTLCVNVLGSFLLGIVTGIALNHWIYLLIATGFLGAFTTFSTFYVELFQMRKRQKWMWIYLVSSYSFGILFAFLGFIISNQWL